MKPVLLFLLMFGVMALGQAQTAVVPGGLMDRFGNSAASIPFDMAEGSSARFQQVYDASEFYFAGVEAITITSIRFRPNQQAPNSPSSGVSFISTLPDIQFNLSTTLRGPDALSATFTENIGLDDTQVRRRGSLSLRSVGGIFPQTFDIVVPLDTPFTYRPGLGNLLLDIRNYGSGPTTFLDRESAIGDGISSLWAYTGDDTGTVESESGFRSTGGLVTLFEFTPIPEPSSVVLLGMAVALVVGLRFKPRQH